MKAGAADAIGFARHNRLPLLTYEDGVEIDLSFGALPFEEEMIRNAEPIEISPGCMASIATAEALVIMKAIAWRRKDQLDIQEIISINNKLDWDPIVDQFAEYAELLEVPERVAKLRALIIGSL